ncbi:Acetyl-/propionyl-coenzyme A carboxylase alpha chain [Pantoea agglomerans]|uniref:Acetyl-/propionyl-coenzyme A carboxylase alpha chain n=1 Tax=Enterobacter agglomerans TaxID=549 RepID=A0A379LQT3_ENTAG|nr:Acetyl-/propionyl-coenzyme A carboxylase alpha chain [Pantoea agglomerans]
MASRSRWWGVDLVQWMIELAAGDLPPLPSLAAALNPQGHAVQARIYAEDPGRQFQPSPGLLTQVLFPAADGKTLRIDRWVEAGCEVPPFFDPMLAKVITWRPHSARKPSPPLAQALAETRLYGVENQSPLSVADSGLLALYGWRTLDPLPGAARLSGGNGLKW